MSLMHIKNILKKSLKGWFTDDPFTQSAAAAYYAVFSLPGLMIMTMSIAAIFLDQARVEQEFFNQIRSIMGRDVAQDLDTIIDETQAGDRDTWAMLIGLITLSFGATGLFVQLQHSLNRIWEVEIKKTTAWVKFLKDRIISLGMILIIGFLLLISLALTSFITLLSEWLATQLSPWVLSAIFWLNGALSLFTITALFALMFKILPDAHVMWRDALAGGVLSALLFIVGEYGLTYYFELAKPETAFGAAGSIVLMMLWIFYACMILFIGAEFAKNYAEARNDCKASPTAIAKKKLKKD